MTFLPPRKKRQRTKPAPDRVESRGHLKWIKREFDCAVSDKVKDGHPRHIQCLGAIEPHHVTTRGAGGGDDQTVPLCLAHHQQWHTIGRLTFAALYGVDLERMAAELWRADSYHRRRYELSLEDA